MTIHLTYTSNCLVAEPLPFPSLRSLTSASFASSLHDEHRKQFFPWISQLHYSIMLLSKTLNYYWVWLHLLSTLQYRHSCLSVSSFLKILDYSPFPGSLQIQVCENRKYWGQIFHFDFKPWLFSRKLFLAEDLDFCLAFISQIK